MIHKAIYTLVLATFSLFVGSFSDVNQELSSQLNNSKQIDQTDPEIRWYSMREAQIKATTSGKKVLVHIYAEWCVWCKKMDNKTYSQLEVQNEISKHYYPVRVDGESEKSINFNGQNMTMKEFAQSLGITAYPTTLFIDKNGDIITQQGGYIKDDIFVKLLSYVGSNAYKLQEFDQFTSNHAPK